MSSSHARLAATAALLAFIAAPLAAQRRASPYAGDTANTQIKEMVSRLSLDHYKATIKGLTKFGDRRQGTARNRAALDWIEAQLKSYGCTNTHRLTYNYAPRPRRARNTQRPPLTAAQREAFRRARENRRGAGGSRARGNRGPTGVNRDSLKQPDPTLRALDTPPSVPGERQDLYCTKIGSVHPDEMYIVSGHMDGIGWGQAANDDGSGTALVMELARVFSMPDVKTNVSIRFILWNNEETGLNGSRAYVEQRAALQGKEDPAGSGKYPEPKWLGMIQHDMMMFDHGMPDANGKVSKTQRPEADVNIEFQSTSKFAEGAEKLAWIFRDANENYATDYPAAVGPHMTNTDSAPFQDLVPAITLRENQRGQQIGAGWDPNWHQPTDVFSTYSDKDFRLGLNAAQTTLGAVATLAGAHLTR
ncbi:MAG TPA: M20/M25/M40 family metallo-hydrolase [Gemmatimonadaceae bacterium]|nr:M20/M25/M40 family metallo-hydrolase [Gemmatimonadaceae bacterium]